MKLETATLWLFLAWGHPPYVCWNHNCLI